MEMNKADSGKSVPEKPGRFFLKRFFLY